MKKNNLYALQKSNKAINEIINDYSAIANQLKMYIFVQSLLNNETAAIGHGKHDVLHNNPYYKSHLVGNGGENIFIITSGYETLDENKLPIPEVIIYDVDTENKIDTLDLRQVKQQIKRDLNREVEARIIVSNQDLLITLLCLNPVKIRLKDALVSDWYDRLSVILDNIHMKIEKGVWLNSFCLKSIPLVFAEDKEIIVIKSEDIEKENKLMISRKAGNYIFARSENDLIITNAFDSNLTDNEFCTISLNKFYQEADMGELVIKFNDKEISLKDNLERINNAIAFSEQLNQHKNAAYSSVFNNNITSISNITNHQRKRREVEDDKFFYTQNDVIFTIKDNQVASSANKPSSWIGDLVSWVKGKLFSKKASERKELFYVHANTSLKGRKQENGSMNNLIAKLYGGLFSSSTRAIRSPTNHKEQESKGSASQLSTGACVNVDDIIFLLDVFIRKITGQKHIPKAGQSIPLQEARGHALNITTEFEQVLNETAFESGIAATNLNFKPVPVSRAIIGHLINGKFSNDKFTEISKILYSAAKEACPEFEQTERFLDQLESQLRQLEEELSEKEVVELSAKKQRIHKSSSKAASNNKPEMRELELISLTLA